MRNYALSEQGRAAGRDPPGRDARGADRRIRGNDRLASRDSDIKGAYVLTMEMWHQETVAIIRAGAEANAFTLADQPENIAWRLIGLVCGLDGIYVLNMPEMDDAAFNKHLDKLISLELF